MIYIEDTTGNGNLLKVKKPSVIESIPKGVVMKRQNCDQSLINIKPVYVS